MPNGFRSSAQRSFEIAAPIEYQRRRRRLIAALRFHDVEVESVDGIDPTASVLGAAEVYVGMTGERADRAAFAPEAAATELHKLTSGNALEPRAVRAVLVAAGHGEPTTPRPRKRVKLTGGLSQREIDVLKLAARGLTTKEIADRLFISTKTTDHHIQHVYAKIGVNTRAAAALWAIQNAVVA